MDEVQPWKDPRDVTSFPDMDKVKPWQETASRESALPNMDELKPWGADQPKPLPGPVTGADDPGPPGTIGVIKSAFGRGAAQEAADLATGTRMLLPNGVGGKTFDQQYKEGLATPQHKDYVDNLLDQQISQGWTNPHWWMAKLANNLGSVTPGLAGAAAASMTPAGPLGGIAAFAGEAAIANLPRAYNAARARGLDDQAAIRQAIIESGIASSFAAVMGLAGKFSVTGKLSQYVSENVADVLQRPVTEAMIQLGVVQPSLMAGQDVASGLARGEMPSADQLATDMAVGGLAGLAIHQVFKERGPREARSEPAAPSATEEAIQGAAAAQAARPLGERAQGLRAGAEPAAPVGTLPGDSEIPDDGRYYERDLTPKTRRDGQAPFAGTEPDAFFSKLSQSIEDMPETLPSKDVIPWLKKRGVKDAELQDAFIPQYLADISGKVKKSDLNAWVEANRVRVFEKIYREPSEDPMADANALYDNYSETYGTRNQRSWPPRAQRHMAQVFAEGQAKAQEVAKTSPQYKAQALPGMRENPEEITFRTPTPEYTQEQIDARGREKWGTDWERVKRENPQEVEAIKGDLTNEDPNVFTGSHHSDPNTFAHVRTYMMRDRDGHLTMVVAEMQSDAHQQAAKMAPVEVTPEHIDDLLREGRPVPEKRVGYRSELTAVIKEAKTKEKEAERRHSEAEAAWKEMKPGQEGYRAKGDEVMALAKAASDAYMEVKNLESRRAVPDLPFKSTWQELLAKRLIMLAANRGATRLAWYNGDQVGLRLENADQLRGARNNYDNKIPSLFEKQAKQFGEHTGETNFEGRPEDPYAAMRPGPFVEQLRSVHQDMGLDMKRVNGPLRYISISPKMAENLYHHGLAMYDKDVEPKQHPVRGTKTLSDFVETNLTPEHLRKPLLKLGTVFNRIANELRITRGIEFVKEEDPNAKYRGFLAGDVNPATGNYQIHVNLSRIMTEADLFASASHEFGHVIKRDLFNAEPDHVKAAIFDAYNKFRDAQTDGQKLVGDTRRERDNAISLMTGARKMHDHYRLSDLTPRSERYFLGFDEWLSEQVAKWMQTDEKPLGIVDKFFKKMGNAVRKMVTKFRQAATGGKAEPDAAVRDWLNTKFGAPRPWVEPIKQQHDMDTTIRAQRAFDREGAPETKAVPMQGSGAGGRDIINNLPPDARGNNGDSMPAHGDRMNLFYKWFLSLPQVATINKHIQQLVNYTSMHRAANVQKNTIMGDAHRRLEQWSRLTDPKQQFALTNFIQEYAHLDQRPDLNTFRDLVNKHKLSDQAVRVFQGVVQDFDGFLDRYRKLLINDALNIKDPTRRALNMQNINTRFDELAKRPFMPITHFGKYSIQIIDRDGNVVHYEQTNSLKRQKQIKEELEKRKNFPTDQVLMGMVPKDVAPFMGMPPGLIDLVAKKLNLSQTQRGMLDQMRFDYAPAQTFKHQFRNLDLVPGYSTDFMRAYAHFFFHGANHLTRVTWIDQMRDQVNSLNSQAERLARAGNSTGANKLDQIVKYMQAHLEAWSDPKSDWGALRGLMFHVYLGANPASAAVNLTQTALSTYPWLASKFGDIATMRALSKASLDWNNFYKQGTLLEAAEKAPIGPEGAWARAQGEAIKQGTLSESQAHQLAAVSEDRNLLRAFGKKGEKFWLKFSEASSWMFDLSEKYNRKVAFKAAWDMALRAGTDHEAVKEAIARDPILWRQLTETEANGGKNWSKPEAAAFLTAKHAVEATQFEYAPWAKPTFMQGKKGTFFIFKQFTQNMLFNLASNPGMLGRWLVIMGALGGVGGLAGYDNVNSVIKTIAARLFGKDFDLDDEVRHFAHDILNDGISPDILLHGMSVKGFGIPHVMHSMGANWFPTIDMSRSVGMGDILGFDPMKLTGLAPSLHPKEEELRQVGRASGAALGMLPSLFDFASSNENFGQLKKYESLMPHWAASLSHSYRWMTQGRETNAAGNTTLRFNPADTENMAEIMARALGFQPRRLTEEWERTQAIKESGDFWDMRHQLLIRQFGDAVKNNDIESKERVAEAIRQFNQQLPPEARAKAITGKALTASVRQRMGVAAKQEAGIPVEKSNIPILQEMEPYYPRGWPKDQVGIKPVQ